MKVFTHESFINHTKHPNLMKIQHSSQSRIVVRRGRPQKWDSVFLFLKQVG